MGIVTKKGDRGMTSLMYNRRLSKSDPRVEASGAVDELNTALGLARATASHDFLRQPLFAIQQDLIILMGELATLPEDRSRYLQDGYSPLTPAMTARLDQLVQEIEAQKITARGWALPGQNLAGATLDHARTIARRAERRVCALQEAGALPNPEVLVFLNRLSDTLWLLARWAEANVT